MLQSSRAPPKRRGGQPGNRNAFKHGRHSVAALLRRALSVARIKALAIFANQSGMLKDTSRFRVSPLRPDQVTILAMNDPDLLALLNSIGTERVYLEKEQASQQR
jgi:hypothetical protein